MASVPPEEEIPAHAVASAPEIMPPEGRAVPPQAAVRKRRTTWAAAPATHLLVGINCAVFLAMVARGISPVSPTVDQLMGWGANNAGSVLINGEWVRIVTAMFVHVGILHLATNMWCLWNLGFLAEVIFDRWTYILTYTACGIAGSLSSLWWHPISVGAGASGAIFGLAGALIAALYLGNLPIPKSALKGTLKSLLTFAGYNLVFGAVGRFIDNSAHIGGLIMGLAIGAVMAPRLTNPEERGRWRVLIFGVVAILLFAGNQYVRKVNGPVINQFLENVGRHANDAGNNRSSAPDQ